MLKIYILAAVLLCSCSAERSAEIGCSECLKIKEFSTEKDNFQTWEEYSVEGINAQDNCALDETTEFIRQYFDATTNLIIRERERISCKH